MALPLTYILIVILIIPIVLGIIKIVREGLTLPAVAGLLFSVMMFGVGIMLQLDTTDFTNKFETSPKTILLDDNNAIIAGFTGVLKEGQPPIFLDQATLDQYTQDYQRGELNAMKKESYKLFIVKRQALGFIEKISFAGEDVSRDDAFTIMNAPDAVDMYADRVVEAGVQREDIAPEFREEAKKQYLDEIQKQIGGSGQIKGALFGALVSEATTQQGPLFLLNSYHNKQVVIYEETFMFKVIKIIPNRILKLASKKDVPIIGKLLS
ncbi:MAG: hypothetical protein Q7R76_02300 [Candidatus Woesearchaeota archaeon]|nr:hypothetical protein [Candidatus Woesearchaeota archaeon]